jgi:hypothetical protein
MDTRYIRRTLTTLAASFALTVSIASAGPVLVVEHVQTPGAERLAIGFEARRLCLRVIAEATLGTLEIRGPRSCAMCRAVGP